MTIDRALLAQARTALVQPRRNWGPKLWPGVAAWWTVKDLPLSEGDPNYFLHDRLTSTYPLVQATASAKPTYNAASLNGRGGLTFSVDDFLTADGVAPLFSGNDKIFTMAGVFSFTHDVNVRDFVSLGSGASANPFMRLMEANNSERWRIVRGDDAAGSTGQILGPTNVLLTSGVAHALVLEFRGQVVNTWVDGVPCIVNAACDVGVATLNRFTLGCFRRNTNSNFVNAVFGEMFIGTSLVTAADVAAASAYLKTEWGTP
jgi:hypothetical protein